jgi:serine/threonine protein kinase
MQGSRNLLKTRCGTVHYISPEVAKGDPYVGMASDIWSVGIILYALVTASLPFDGPNSIVVLKKIVRGVFSIPEYVPKELQDLIRLMLTLDPTERITIPQIKQHPWYMGADDTPRSVRSNFDKDPEELYVITLDELQQNSDVLHNLRLLGWEETELMNELLDTKNNMAKAFYKLLIEQKKLPTSNNNSKTDTPQTIDRKVLRRRSIASPASASRIGVASDLTKSPSHTQNNNNNNISKSRKRASTRTNQFAPQLPVKTTTTTQPRTRRKSSVGQPPSPVSSAANHTSITPPADHSAKLSGGSGGEKNNNKNVIWSTSTEAEPESSSNSKEYQIEANKSVTQILEALKHCFADLGQFDLSAKQTKNGIKVKARRSGKRGAVVTVNFTQKDGDSSLRIKKGKSKEDFKEFIKKVEETLVV